MISSFKYYANLIVPMVLGGLTLHIPRVSGDALSQKAPDKLSLSIEPATASSTRRLPTSVRWKEREYDVDTGIGVLMGAVRDPEKDTNERELALIGLAMLRTKLKGHPCLDELAQLYDAANEPERGGILICLLGARDPRGIPVFLRALDNERNMKLRLWAADALVAWNLRRGVAELIGLLDSKEVLPNPVRMPYVRDNALESLRKSNAHKGWGIPDEEIRSAIDTQLGIDREAFKRGESVDEETRKSIEAQTRGLREKFDAMYFAEIRKWFAENEHRFPDWKPGDPLPEAPGEAPAPNPSDE